MKRGCILLMISFIAGLVPLPAGEIPGFRKIIDDFLSVSSVKASITQYIYLENGETEVFSGNYFAASKGFIRIDYNRPERQSVVINNSGLYWYYPDRGILFLSEKKGENSGPVPVLMNMIPAESMGDIEVVSEGAKFYSFFKIADVYTVTSRKNKTRVVLWVDPLMVIVKRKIMLDEYGREIMKEEYLDFERVEGIWIPSKIELKARTAEGIVHTLTEYRDIVINTRIDKDLFKFNVTPDMKVRLLGDR